MSHCVESYVVNDVSKDHIAFIFKEKQSKKRSSNLQLSAIHRSTVYLSREYPNRVAKKRTISGRITAAGKTCY